MSADTRLEELGVSGLDEVDEPVFSGLAERHRRELHAHCYRMLGSFEDAEDTVQEKFLRAWRRRETFEGRSTFRAWLYRIATNACLDLLAKCRPEPATGGEEGAGTRELVRRYTDASVATDVDGLAALLRDDVRCSMPPTPGLYVGRETVVNDWVEHPPRATPRPCGGDDPHHGAEPPQPDRLTIPKRDNARRTGMRERTDVTPGAATLRSRFLLLVDSKAESHVRRSTGHLAGRRPNAIRPGWGAPGTPVAFTLTDRAVTRLSRGFRSCAAA
ncbi:sigma-70 family RNA polymerase sigma factor [Streptosporangium sp. H16]|uniref:sigma-70 family RNA polymerase sigma factor n=1 Tax=Streptosporangium sp. H16 TaxID=3444184 RepID=UPI003F7A5FB5